MKRGLLVAAMALSLWPAWAILLLGNGNREAPVGRRHSFLRHSKPSPARPKLEEIAAHAHELNEDLGEAELTRGEPQYDFAYRANGIEEELLQWRRESRGEATGGEERVARRLIALMQTVVALAEFPSQGTLRPYDRALRRFNAAIKSA